MSASAPAAAPLPTAVVKLIHRISYSVHRSVDEENRYHQRLANSIGLTYTAPDTRKQEDALVAAKVAKALTEDEVYADYADLVEDVYLALDVPRSHFTNWFGKKLTQLSGMWTLFAVLANHESFLWKLT